MTQSAIPDYRLSAELTQRLMSVQQFTEIDSTNVEAMRQLQSGRSGCFLLLAHSQTAGRGRRGKVWQSPAGAGIYLTLVWAFPVTITQLQSLSLVAALSVHEAMQSCGVAGIKLKWPNDLMARKCKLAGILLELKQSSEASHVLFGIGINLNLARAVRDSIEQPVTDLSSLLQGAPDKSLVVTRVVESLLDNLDEFERSGFEPFRARWNALDFYLGEDIVLQTGDRRKIGKSLGVDETGALLLQTTTGLEKINGGEIFPSLYPANHELLREPER